MSSLFFYHPSWPVLHEDNHLLVLYKPAGLLVQGDLSEDISLLELGKAWLKERWHKPGRVFLGLVHRLDRPVAGVMVFARTSKAAARLSEQFRSTRPRKVYVAVVEGELKADSGLLVDEIERDERTAWIVPAKTKRSKEARLSYRLLDTAGDRSLVEIRLETGRRHQIRVQMARIGHPVVGDIRYGAAAPLPEKQIALLARELTVEHPTRREPLAFVSPFPRGWPWPAMQSPDDGPPWNWSELRALVRLPDMLADPCAFRESMKKCNRRS